MAGLLERIRFLLDPASAAKLKSDAEKAGKDTGGAFESGMSGFKGFLKGLAGAVAAAFTVRAVVNFGRASMQAAAESEAAWSRLTGAVNSVGMSIDDARGRAEELAKWGLDKTVFGDEAMLESLATLTQMTGDYEKSLEGVRTAANLAAARHMDLGTATQLVGRGLTGNTQLFSRQGIQIDKNRDLLTQLNDTFDGYAEREAGTWGGATKRLGNLFGELKEAIGTAMIEAGSGASVMDTLIGVVQGATRWVTENRDAIRVWIVNGWNVLANTVTGVTFVFRNFVDLLNVHYMGTLSKAQRAVALLADGVAVLLDGLSAASRLIGAPEDAAMFKNAAEDVRGYTNELRTSADEAERQARAAQDALNKRREELRYRALITQADLTATAGMGGTANDRPTGTGRRRIETEEERRAREQREREELAATKRLAEERVALTARAEDEIRALTATAVDDMVLAFERLKAEVIAKFGEIPPAWAQVFAGMQDQIDTTRFLEGFDPAWEALEARGTAAMEQLAAGGINAFQAVVPEIENAIETLERQRDALTPQSTAWKSIDDRIKVARTTLRGMLTDVGNANVEMGEADAKTKTWKDKVLETADAFSNVAKGVLGVLDGLGLMNEEMKQVAEGAIKIADAMPGILSGNPTAIIAGIGGAVQMIGGLFGGGESPEEKARKEALRENTRALLRLASGMERQNISAAELALLTRARNLGTQANESLWLLSPESRANWVARTIGIPLEELQEIARRAGVEFVATAEGMRQLSEAIQMGFTTGYANDYAGQIQKLNDTFLFLDIEDPIKQLQEFQKVMGRIGSPGLSGLGRFDLSTEAGRAAAEREVERMFQQYAGGSRTQLGDLTDDEFLQALRDFQQYLTTATEAAARGGGVLDPFAAQTVAVNESITRTEAMRMDAQMTTMNVWLSQIAGYTSVLPQLALGGRFGLAVSIGDINVGGGTATPEARADIVAAVNEGLGAALQRSSLAAGNVVMQ